MGGGAVPVIDIHAHILTEELVDALRGAGMSVAPRLEPAHDAMLYLAFSNGVRFGPFPSDIVDVDKRRAEMDRQGVDVQVIAAVPMLFGV